jgi:opine dehydrogenase
MTRWREAGDRGLTVVGSTVPARLVAAVAAAAHGPEVTLVAQDVRAASRQVTVVDGDSTTRATLTESPILETSEGICVFMGAARDWGPFVEQHAERLHGGHLVAVGCGVGAAAYGLRVLDTALGLGHDTALAEVQSFPHVGSIEGGRHEILAAKQNMSVGCPIGDAADAAAAMSRWLPGARAEDYLTVTFADVNPLIHPVVCIANARLIDEGSAFGFYTVGLTPRVAGLIGAADTEKRALLAAAGVSYRSILDTLGGFYRDQGFLDSSIGAALTAFPAFASATGPNAFDHRYLVDDVVFGLEPLVHLGRAVGVATPVMAGVCALARVLAGSELSSDQRWEATLPWIESLRRI